MNPRKHARSRLPVILTIITPVFLVSMILLFQVDIPFQDQWDLVPLLQKSYESQLHAGDLWALYGEHRMFFPRLMMILLAHITRWNILWESLFSVLLAGGLFSILVHASQKILKTCSRTIRLWVIPVLSFLIFSMNQAEVWFWGWQMQMLLCVLPVVAGIFILSCRTPTWLNLLFAILLGVAASYSVAFGLAYWVIGLIPILLRENRNRFYISARMVVWIMAGAAVFFFYFRGYIRPESHSFLEIVFKNPFGYLRYILNFLGAPLTTYADKIPLIGDIFAALIGASGLLLFVYTTVKLKIRRYMNRTYMAGFIALALFSILSAFIAGIGRAGFGSIQALSFRYVPISSLLWITNIIFLLALAGTRPVTSVKKLFFGKGYNLLIPVIISICFLVTISSVHGVVFAYRRQNRLLRARESLFCGTSEYIDQDVLENLQVPFEGLTKKIDVLRKYNLSVFRDSQL